MSARKDGIPDELVEKAACAHYESLEWGGCAGGGWIRQPEGPRNDRMDAMRAALEAVGLPALFADLKHEEHEHEKTLAIMEAALDQRDALAAKVADAWDEGRDAGWSLATRSAVAVNPHRATPTEMPDGLGEWGPNLLTPEGRAEWRDHERGLADGTEGA